MRFTGTQRIQLARNETLTVRGIGAQLRQVDGDSVPTSDILIQPLAPRRVMRIQADSSHQGQCTLISSLGEHVDDRTFSWC